MRITGRNGATIFLSAPSARSAPSMPVTRAMIRKMLNSSWAATRLALNTAVSPVTMLLLNTSAVRNVKVTAGTMMFLRVIIVARITMTPRR